jgi:hypothetical protein
MLNDLNSENLQLLEASHDLEGWTYAIVTSKAHACDRSSLCRNQSVEESSRGHVVSPIDDKSRLREGFQGSLMVDLSTDLEKGQRYGVTIWCLTSVELGTVMMVWVG